MHITGKEKTPVRRLRREALLDTEAGCEGESYLVCTEILRTSTVVVAFRRCAFIAWIAMDRCGGNVIGDRVRGRV